MEVAKVADIKQGICKAKSKVKKLTLLLHIHTVFLLYFSRFLSFFPSSRLHHLAQLPGEGLGGDPVVKDTDGN